MVRGRLAVMLAWGACACASRQQTFRDDGYHNDRYSYQVGYASPGQLASSDWTLENFQVDDAGHPKTPKVGGDYRFTFRADIDGDGKMDRSEEMDLVDLRLVHKKTAARIWLTSMPIAQTLAETDLAVLAKELVSAVAGAGLRIERLGDSASGKQQTYATRIVEEKKIEVDGMPAYRVTFEMASVDQLKLDPKSRWQRVGAVLIRPGFFWGPEDLDDKKQLFPVLLVAGYVSQPEQFDAAAADFEAFVGRIRFAPTELSTQLSKIVACAPGREPIRVVVLLAGGEKVRVVSPDLGAQESTCAADVLNQQFWDFNARKSFIIRKTDASR